MYKRICACKLSDDFSGFVDTCGTGKRNCTGRSYWETGELNFNSMSSLYCLVYFLPTSRSPTIFTDTSIPNHTGEPEEAWKLSAWLLCIIYLSHMSPPPAVTNDGGPTLSSHDRWHCQASRLSHPGPNPCSFTLDRGCQDGPRSRCSTRCRRTGPCWHGWWAYDMVD